MSERRWQRIGDQPSWVLDTPVGRAMVAQVAGQESWTAQLEVTTGGVRQSQQLSSRDEAEAWVEQQVVDVQRASDVAPAV